MSTQTKQVGRTSARFFRAMAASKGNGSTALSFVDDAGWIDHAEIKAAVSAMTMGGTSDLAKWVSADFVDMVMPQTIIGRLASLRRIPFKTPTVRKTSGTVAFWVPEGTGKPLSIASFNRVAPIEARKVCAMSVITQELAQTSEAESIISTTLREGAVEELDLSFIDPTNAGVADERPASITFGVTPIVSTNDLADDVEAALATFQGSLLTAYWLMHPRLAAQAGIRSGGKGLAADLGALGGTLAGLPVLTSESIPLGTIDLIDAAGIELGGSDEAELRISTEASVLMTDESSPTASSLVSLWQTNSIALLGEIFVNWRVARPGSVVVVNGADYSGA